jgi:hypothetical protein
MQKYAASYRTFLEINDNVDRIFRKDNKKTPLVAVHRVEKQIKQGRLNKEEFLLHKVYSI